MLVRKTCILFLFAALLGAGSLRAQQLSVEARIAGLESNEEYMSLLREDAQLQMREDSIVNAVERARRQLRENPAARQQYSQDILQLESRIFEIRNAKGRLIDRINTIEQEWVLANLNGAASQPAGPAAENPAAEIPDSLKVRNLVSNPYFREQLPEADYAALVEAQRLEFDAVDYVNRYFANYGTISELAEAYAAAQAEADAAEIYDKYKTLQGFNRVLADSLSDAWNYIFDNKSYAYGYLMDKLGRDEILSREEERLSEAARQLSELRGETASDAVTDYFLRKKVLVGYETSVADMLGLTSARDSLRGVTAQLEVVGGGDAMGTVTVSDPGVRLLLANGLTAENVSVSLELPERYILGVDPEAYAVYTIQGGGSQETASVRVKAKIEGLEAVVAANADVSLPASRSLKKTAGGLIAISLGSTVLAAVVVFAVIRMQAKKKKRKPGSKH